MPQCTLLVTGSVDAAQTMGLLNVGYFLLRVTTCKAHGSLIFQFVPKHRSQTNRDQSIASKGQVRVTVPVILDLMMAASSA